MSYSLPSRDLILDNIDLSINGYMCDGAIIIAGCDKSIAAAGISCFYNNVPKVVL